MIFTQREQDELKITEGLLDPEEVDTLGTDRPSSQKCEDGASIKASSRTDPKPEPYKKH